MRAASVIRPASPTGSGPPSGDTPNSSVRDSPGEKHQRGDPRPQRLRSRGAIAATTCHWSEAHTIVTRYASVVFEGSCIVEGAASRRLGDPNGPSCTPLTTVVGRGAKFKRGGPPFLCSQIRPCTFVRIIEARHSAANVEAWVVGSQRPALNQVE